MNITRRDAFHGASALALVVITGGSAALAKAGKPTMIMHRWSGCDCCLKWAALARRAGYVVQVKNVDNMRPTKVRLGVPEALYSCHTTEVGGYVVEGHVPFGAVERLLRDNPTGVAGIAVPGMPAGAPGMESHGDHGGGDKAKIDVYAFNRVGEKRPFSF